jgi:hypothetical protein
MNKYSPVKKARLPPSIFKNQQLYFMKNLRNLTLFTFLLLTSLGLIAQNGNVVVSHIEIEDLGNGTGMIVVKLSGNQAASYLGGAFTISGDRIANGSASSGLGVDSRVFIAPPVPGNGNSQGNQQVLLAGIFPIGSGPGSDDVDIQLSFFPGNGLDWTYYRRMSMRRIKGI